MMQKPPAFSLGYWEHLISALRVGGYAVTSYRDYYEKRIRGFICLLRHDVEDSPQKALMLAKMESHLGVSASYFFRVHSPNYNPADPEVVAIIRALIAMGHEVGLHTEPIDFSAAFGLSMLEVIRREKEFLEAAIGRPIRSLAPHGDWTRLRFPYEKARENRFTVPREEYYSRQLSRGSRSFRVLRLGIEWARDLLWRAGLILPSPRLAPGNLSSVIDICALGFEYATTDDLFVRTFRHFGDGEGFFEPGDPSDYIGKSPRMVVNAHPHWWYLDFYHLGSVAQG